MSNLLTRKISLFILSTSLFLLFSCAASFNNTGKIAQMQSAVLLSDPISNRGFWDSNDVMITYKITESENPFAIEATLKIKDNITLSFNLVESFSLYITYLDKNGKGLATHNISPVFRYRKLVPEITELGTLPPPPANADGFTFSYWGYFRSNTSDDSKSNWEIYFNPFK